MGLWLSVQTLLTFPQEPLCCFSLQKASKILSLPEPHCTPVSLRLLEPPLPMHWGARRFWGPLASKGSLHHCLMGVVAPPNTPASSLLIGTL